MGLEWRAMALGLVLAGCAGPTDGRWVGPVMADGPGCPSSRGVLEARDGRFVFAPSEGVVVLRGTVSPSGDMHGVFETEGSNHQPVRYRFDGRLAEHRVEGVLDQPGCRSRVALQPG
jgi:hypothetical protein